MTIQEFQQLKFNLENSQNELNKTIGALDQLKKRLKDEYGCSIKEALEEIEKLQSKNDKQILELEKVYNQFKKKYEEKLNVN